MPMESSSLAGRAGGGGGSNKDDHSTSPLLRGTWKSSSFSMTGNGTSSSDSFTLPSTFAGYGKAAGPTPPRSRRHRWLVYLFTLAVVYAFVSVTRRIVHRINDRKHVFDITLRTTVEPFQYAKDPQKVFTWSKDVFLPNKESPFTYLNGSLAEFRGYQRSSPPAKEHTIAIYPRKAELGGFKDDVKPEEIVFGFNSPYLRVRDMCRTWKHFLQSGAQCVIGLPKEEETFIKDLKYYLEKENLQHCHVYSVDLGKYPRYEQRVMNTPRLMYNAKYVDRAGNAVEPKWFVVADDDTQVLDLRLLQRELNQRPHTERHLLCALTESATQVGRHGKICYGGGGIVISRHFAGKMTEHMDECFWWHHWRFGGDEMLTHCASTSTANGTSSIPPDQVMEFLDGLHQIDIPGDGTGIFQSGLPFISIHHYTGWLEIFPPWSAPDRMDGLRRMQRATNFFGGDNLLKRFIFDNGSTLLTLGYSITLFSEPLRQYEMQLIERTHRHWEHDLRWPSRPNIPEGKQKGKNKNARYKVTYYLKEIFEEENLVIYENQHKDIIRLKVHF